LRSDQIECPDYNRILAKLGSTTHYGYDRSDRPTPNTTFIYDDLGLITDTTIKGDRSYPYDKVGNLTQVDNLGTAGVPRVQLDYAYDPANNLTTVTDTINTVLKGTTLYTYDKRDRVTQISQSGAGVTTKRVDMAYNVASQMTDVTRFLGTSAKLKSTYVYDLAGRLSQREHVSLAMSKNTYPERF
jgi:YD repeat-containing protein